MVQTAVFLFKNSDFSLFFLINLVKELPSSIKEYLSAKEPERHIAACKKVCC